MERMFVKAVDDDGGSGGGGGFSMCSTFSG